MIRIIIICGLLLGFGTGCWHSHWHDHHHHDHEWHDHDWHDHHWYDHHHW